jgi:hypothetical protein
LEVLSHTDVVGNVTNEKSTSRSYVVPHSCKVGDLLDELAILEDEFEDETIADTNLEAKENVEKVSNKFNSKPASRRDGSIIGLEVPDTSIVDNNNGNDYSDDRNIVLEEVLDNNRSPPEASIKAIPIELEMTSNNISSSCSSSPTILDGKDIIVEKLSGKIKSTLNNTNSSSKIVIDASKIVLKKIPPKSTKRSNTKDK